MSIKTIQFFILWYSTSGSVVLFLYHQLFLEVLEVEIIHVPSPHPSAQDTKIRYMIYGEKCVFSQAKYSDNVTSSISMAEDIADAICKQEKLKLQKMSFFDFQSSAGIRALCIQEPGDYEYDELVFDGSYSRVIYWKSTVCPPEVVQDFGIGPNPKQVNLPKG